MKKNICKVNKPVTKKEIEFVEQKFHVHLPEAYIKLLKISNGGALNFRWLDVQEVEELKDQDGYIYVD